MRETYTVVIRNGTEYTIKYTGFSPREAESTIKYTGFSRRRAETTVKIHGIFLQRGPKYLQIHGIFLLRRRLYRKFTMYGRFDLPSPGSSALTHRGWVAGLYVNSRCIYTRVHHSHAKRSLWLGGELIVRKFTMYLTSRSPLPRETITFAGRGPDCT